jgi:hypothetical protein
MSAPFVSAALKATSNRNMLVLGLFEACVAQIPRIFIVICPFYGRQSSSHRLVRPIVSIVFKEIVIDIFIDIFLWYNAD